MKFWSIVFLTFLSTGLFAEDTPLQRTIKTRETSLWLQMLNRGTSLNTHRGYLRDYDSRMDEAYRIDWLSYDYLMTDDYRFHQADRGLRDWVGSINTSRFFTNLDFKLPVALNENWEFKLEFHQLESYQAEHNILLATVGRDNLFDVGLGFYMQFTAQTIKEDLDLAFGARLKRENLKVDWQVAFLDFVNNAIHEGNGIKKNQLHHQRTYDGLPIATRLRVEWNFLETFKLEFNGAINAFEKSTIEFKDSLGDDFTREGSFGYAQILLEKRINENLTLGAFVELGFGSDQKEGSQNEDFDLDEFRGTYDVYALYRLNEKWHFEAEVKYIQYDLQSRGSTSEDIRDNQDWGAQFAVQFLYKWKTRWHWVGGFFVDRHVLTNVLDDYDLTETNLRAKWGIRYDNTKGFYFMFTNNIDFEDSIYSYGGSSGQIGYTW